MKIREPYKARFKFQASAFHP